MKRRIKPRREIVAIFLLIATVLSPAILSAEDQHSKPGGLFGGSSHSSPNGLLEGNRSIVGSNLDGQTFGTINGNITGQTFGAPLDSGLFVLLVAGACYATMKSRKKQTQNKKENPT